MKDLNTSSVLALHHCIVLSSPPRLVRVRDRELVTLGGRPPSWLGGWCSGDLFKKIVKRPGLLLRGACEVVVELAISGVEKKLAIRKGLFLRGIGSENRVSLRGVGESFVGPPPLQT